MASRWRASEDRLLASMYARQVPLRAIAQRLGRSEEAIGARRRLLGIGARRTPVRWTEQQDRLIVAAVRAGVPAAEIARQLGRSSEQVKGRRRRLVGTGTATRRYEPWEDEAITVAWRTGTDLPELAGRLGRSAGAVALRARALGVHQPARRLRWTKAEDHALREGYTSGLGCREISRRELPHRTPGAIAARARRLGMTSYGRLWTGAEDQRLGRLLAREAPVGQIAAALTRTPEAIRQRARKLRLAAPARRDHAHRRRWRPDEDEILRTHPGAHPGTLAMILQRSDQAIRQRQHALGVRGGDRSPHAASPRSHPFSPAEDRLVQRELVNGSPTPYMRAKALSARLERPLAEVRRRARELAPEHGRVATPRAG